MFSCKGTDSMSLGINVTLYFCFQKLPTTLHFNIKGGPVGVSLIKRHFVKITLFFLLFLRL